MQRVLAVGVSFTCASFVEISDEWLTYLGERWTTAFIANVMGPAIDRDFTLPGTPRVPLPSHTKLDLASYAVAQQVWSVRNMQLQMKIENLLNEDL
jgi:hypothetical protein